jgi:hypothetical protein
MQKKDTKTYRKTDFTLSSTIERLYGNREYRKLKSHHNLTKARNTYLRIVKSVRFAIDETMVTTDNSHKEELEYLLNAIDDLLIQATNVDEPDQRMISYYLRFLAFVQTERVWIA